MTVLDSGGVTFSRVWCCYEIYISLMLRSAHKYEVYTSQEHLYDESGNYPPDFFDFQGPSKFNATTDEKIQEWVDSGAEMWCRGVVEARTRQVKRCAVGITSAPVYTQAGLESVEGRHRRQSPFNLALLKGAAGAQLQFAQASQQADRARILNEVTGIGGELEPPKQHAKYEELNQKLHGRFILALIRPTIEAKATLAEITPALRTSGLTTIDLDFTGMIAKTRSGAPQWSDDLSDEAKEAMRNGQVLVPIFQSLPLTLVEFECKLDASAIDAQLAFASSLKTLKQLRTLKLTGIWRKAGKAVGTALHALLSLEQLCLEGGIGCGGCMAVFEMLAGSTSLQRLEIESKNIFYYPGEEEEEEEDGSDVDKGEPREAAAAVARAIANGLRQNRSLKYLDVFLVFASLADAEAAIVADGLKDHPTLTFLRAQVAPSSWDVGGGTHALVRAVGSVGSLTRLAFIAGPRALQAPDRMLKDGAASQDDDDEEDGGEGVAAPLLHSLCSSLTMSAATSVLTHLELCSEKDKWGRFLGLSGNGLQTLATHTSWPALHTLILRRLDLSWRDGRMVFSGGQRAGDDAAVAAIVNPFVEMVAALPSLTSLDLTQMEPCMPTRSGELLFKQLHALKSPVVDLNLASCRMFGVGTASVAESMQIWLKGNPEVRSLNLMQNEFTPSGCEVLLNGLLSNTSLVYLNLIATGVMGDQGADEFDVPAEWMMQELTDTDGLAALCKVIQIHPSLKMLDLLDYMKTDGLAISFQLDSSGRAEFKGRALALLTAALDSSQGALDRSGVPSFNDVFRLDLNGMPYVEQEDANQEWEILMPSTVWPTDCMRHSQGK